MTKRFGRNQRRALREAIHEADAALEAAQGEIERQRALTHSAWKEAQEARERFNGWAERIYALVGPGSAFAARPMTERVREDYLEMVQRMNTPHYVRLSRPLSIADLMAPRTMRPYAAEAIVEAFALFASAHHDAIGQNVIVRLEVPDGPFALALDVGTYRELRARDPGYLVRYFHERIMRALIDLEQKTRRGEPGGRRV